MNKRKIVVAMTIFFMAQQPTTVKSPTEFNSREIVVENINTISEDTPKPMTAILESKEVKIEDLKNTINMGGKVLYYKRKVNIVATHYTNSVADCGNTKGITASGVRASRGTVAVPNNVPFGTEIILEDDNGNKQLVVAQDRGGAIKWIDADTMKIDVFVPNATRKQLLDLGVKRYTGYIVEKVK